MIARIVPAVRRQQHSAPGFIDGTTDVFDDQLQVRRIGWRGFEAEALIERSRRVVDRVNEHQAHPGLIGNRKRPGHRVSEQEGANALALNGLVNREPSEQHCWNRMLRHAFAHPLGRFAMLDRGDRKGVIADDSILIGIDEDVGPGGAGRGGRAGVFDQPEIQRSDLAIKSVDPMLAVERCWV